MAKTIPGFLRLPLELRLQIYTIAMDRTLGIHPISEVSRQIRQEVIGIYFKSPKGFNSLEQLARWTARGPPHLLPQVSNISIHIFEESLLPIANTTRKQSSDLSSNAVSPLTAEFWEVEYARRVPAVEDSKFSWVRSFIDCVNLCEQNLEKTAIASVWESFTALSQVRKVWLLLQDIHSGMPVRRFDVEQQLLLDMMAAAFTHLQDLTVFSNHLPLEYMRNFHDLRSLRFTGYSTSTVKELLDILRSLNHLDTIIIYRYPEYSDKENWIITSELPKYLSLTPEVIAALNPLKEYHVHHMASAVQSAHISIPVIGALRAHASSLRSLNLYSDAPFNFEVIASIFQFTASSQLKDIRLSLISRQFVDDLYLDTVFPKHIKHGEASMRHRMNLRYREEHLYWHTITSSSNCLVTEKGDRSCICTRSKLLHITNTETFTYFA